jgi:serine/threonine protein kinase
MRTGDELLVSVARLFEAGGRLEGRYDLDLGAPPRQVSDGVSWEYRVRPRGSTSHELMRVYDVRGYENELAKAHWRNETRALLRLQSRMLPSLPSFRDADYVENDFAFILTSDTGTPLDALPDLRAGLRADRERAWLRFFGLVEALSAMHEEGLIHDRLTLNAVRAPAQDALILDGFHMTSFLATWFRPGGAAGAVYPIGASLAPLQAPERLQSKSPPSYVSDVFSLGHVAARLFADEVPLPPLHDESTHYEWNERQRRVVREAALPRLLTESILAMTEFDRRDRPASAVAVCDRLAAGHDAILHEIAWRAGSSEEIYELLYLDESIERLHRDGLAASPPSRPDYGEYNSLIERDLERAPMVWSPEGFAPWERHSRKRAQEARVVLLGRTYAYFCAFLRHGRAGLEDRTRLVVKHMRPIEQTLVLKRRRLKRAAPRVKCSHLRPTGAVPARVLGTTEASWADLIAAIRGDDRVETGEVTSAARWLLDAQRGEYRRRWFYVNVSLVIPGGDLVRLEAIEQPPGDATDLAGAFDTLWQEVSPRDRMDKAFAALHHHELEEGELQIFLLRRLREDREPLTELTFERDDGPNACIFRMTERVDPLPVVAWVSPDDRSAIGVLNRQQEAVLELEERCNHLASQLRHPSSVRIPLDTLEPDEDKHEPLVRTILETWPMFVVQGPPGTGKTRLAARIVDRVLTQDPFSRILVAAQSHQAVDNLLAQVAERRPEDLLRIASERTERRLSAAARNCTLEARLKSLLAKCKGATGSDTIKQWAKRAKSEDPLLAADLLGRLRGSSAVTFVSTAQASADRLGANRGPATYDWVMLEEAARGWITDFLMPMTHGSRWLLIGDQAQLAAHQHSDYERLFDHDLAQEVTARATGTMVNPEWRKYLGYFAHLMTVAPLSSQMPALPRQQLTLQHRMHPDIGSLISETFYQGNVSTHKRATRSHKLKGAPFDGTSLLWLDTSPLGITAHEGHSGGLVNWAEVHVLNHLVLRRIGAPPQYAPKIAPLVVISPYRAQRKLLRERLHLDEEQVHTVDSFQGGQAEIVLVSLVRNNPINDSGRAIGFLREPSRVNVMFSRARRLLVVVGSLAHFEQHGARFFWKDICAYFRAETRFVRAVRPGDLPELRQRIP